MRGLWAKSSIWILTTAGIAVAAYVAGRRMGTCDGVLLRHLWLHGGYGLAFLWG